MEETSQCYAHCESKSPSLFLLCFPTAQSVSQRRKQRKQHLQLQHTTQLLIYADPQKLQMSLKYGPTHGAKSARPIKGRLRCASDIGFLSPFFMEEGNRASSAASAGQNNKPDICHISDTAKRMPARKGLLREGRWSTLLCTQSSNWRMYNLYVQVQSRMSRYLKLGRL